MMVYQGKKHVSVIMQAHILVNTKQLKIPITSGRFDPTGKKISLRLNISRARLAFLDHGASNRRRCGQNGVIPTPAARLGIQGTRTKPPIASRRRSIAREPEGNR